MAELTRRASSIVADLELFLAGGKPNYPAIAAAHGWPNVAAVRENIAALKPLGDLTVTFDIPEKESAMPQPTPPPPQPRPNAGQTMTMLPDRPQDTIANLLAAAHQHDKPAIRKQAEKIDTLLARLRAEIKADREDAARRKEIADLKARLAQLEGKKPKAGTVTKGEFRCATCDSAFDTKQGVTLHHTRVHRESA